MDKKELQRMLQEKFAKSSTEKSLEELGVLLKERGEEWLQELKTLETYKTDLLQLQQKVLDNIQGFCVTYLYNSTGKTTFELKPGSQYGAMQVVLNQLSEGIKQQNSLNGIQEVLQSNM